MTNAPEREGTSNPEETAAATHRPESEESWLCRSWRGWRLWLEGPPSWIFTVAVLLLLHLSFLPLPPDLHNPWLESAWDTHVFADSPAADFFSIHEAGRRARAGLNPYGINLPDDRVPVDAPYFASYRYLPITTYTLAVPLSLIPPWWAYVFWILLNEVLLLVNLGLTAAWAPRAIRRPLGALWLAYFPLHIEWHLGQFSFFMGCLVFWCGLALWRGRTTAAVNWWGLSGALKNWTLIFWPFWLRRNRRVAWISCVWVVLIGATTVGYFAAQPDHFKAFYRHAGEKRWSGGIEDLYWGRQGTQMMVASLLTGGRMPEERSPDDPSTPMLNRMASIVNGGVSALALALIVWGCLWRGRTAHPLDLLALAWMWWFFAYLDTWEHHYVMLLPLLALLGMAGRLSGWRLWIPAVLWAAPSLWLLAGPAAATRDSASPLLVLVYFWQRPVAVVFLFGYIAWRVIRSSPPPVSS